VKISKNLIVDRNPPAGKGKWHFSLWNISRVSLGNLYKNLPPTIIMFLRVLTHVIRLPAPPRGGLEQAWR